MPLLCPTCSRPNPADAAYCYYDGRALAAGSQAGPVGFGTRPFPIPFCFPDGQNCANFNQLALACDERWNEAKGLLAQGIWQSFFSTMGRLDLAAAARQAALEPDRDVGFSHFLERLPADPAALRPPKLAVPSADTDLSLEPGKDHKFELRITNQGMLVLRGMVTTDCDWLSLGEQPGAASLKMFQTRNFYNLPVRVLGNRLRAGRKPLEGQIVIDTNGGSLTVPVRATVSVRPFPKGQANDVLAGARSPRELAAKAKAHPQEAAVLFEQGAVKAWYVSNGWTYPLHVTAGMGKGAVQQFFEALGLAKPPVLEISTASIACQGHPGQRLTTQVTVRTKESRYVWAQARSNQAWIKAGPGNSQGNAVTIPLHIDVPPRPGETLHADVTFQGNGNQLFVVSLKLAVAAVSPTVAVETVRPAVAAGPGKARGRLPVGWIVAAAALLLIGVGGAVLVRGPTSIVPDVPPPPPPVVPVKDLRPWWDSIPDCNLAASVAAVKETVPELQAVFDGLAVRSDVDRYQPYEQLAAKLPGLVRNPKVKDPLARLVTDCCVYEESDRNIAHLQRALTLLIPQPGAEFRPEDKGAELDCALWSLEVNFAAMTHKAIPPERVRSLTSGLDTVFGFSLDTRAAPPELKRQAERLLAQRCYRNMAKTAATSMEHALVIRAVLLEKFAHHLAPGFRDAVDVSLIAAGLSRGHDAWAKLEPIVKTCLEGNPDIGLQVADLYEKAKPDQAQMMEKVLAATFKAVDNPNWTRAERTASIRKSLLARKISPGERLNQLQRLTGSALAGSKPGEKKPTKLQQDTIFLQDSVRLAHASTMACILFHKEVGRPDHYVAIERFDDYVAQVPEIEDAEPAKVVAKPSDDKPKKPAEKEVLVVSIQPRFVQGQLTRQSERDRGRAGAFCKVYAVSMKAGFPYTIDMVEAGFDIFLRLESPNGAQVGVVNRGGTLLGFRAPADGEYRLVATSYRNGEVGAYSFRIQQGVPFGINPLFRRGLIPPPLNPAPEAPKADEKKADEKKEGQVDLKDLDKLGDKQSDVRVDAFTRLAGSVANDLAPQHAQKIARYLMSRDKAELEKVTAKLGSLARCRHLLLALADCAANDDKVRQQTAEAIVGVVLGQDLRFARDEDWRSGCGRMLLQRVLDLTASTKAGADQAAEFLRQLYKEQGMAFGIDDPKFLELTRPTQVLESVIRHVAAKAGKEKPGPPDKDYLEQIGRYLLAAGYVAENDLEHMVLLQRIWIKVLTIYLQQQVPAQAKGMSVMEQDLLAHDRKSPSALDQLRAGEEKVLRLWARAHDLK